MLEMAKKPEISEGKPLPVENFKDIKPQEGMTPNEASLFWDSIFKGDEPSSAEVSDKKGEAGETDTLNKNLEQAFSEYIEVLKDKSECPETIPDCPFEVSDLEKPSPEEIAERRDEFDDVKADLKKQWEEEHGQPWPTYEHDVCSANGRLIRMAGKDYDVHHIQPLCMGGKNEVSNITPLHAEVHYDSQGVHSSDSPLTKMDRMLGGAGS